MAVVLNKRRFTIEEYDRMAEAGVLPPEDRVELIEGEIVEMSPIGTPHAGVVNRLNYVFSSRLGGRAIVQIQNPIALPPVVSVPQPDVALLRSRQDFYSKARPLPGDVLLVVEVMETSADYDRGVKLPLYGKAGVIETWLVDLGASAVEVYRRPAGERYQDTRVVSTGKSITLHAFPDVTLTLADILG
jgi:Uma2 family endonuclease